MNGHSSHYESHAPHHPFIGGVSDGWTSPSLPSTASLNYHAASHLDHPATHHQSHPLDTSGHPHTYPSQQLSARSHSISAETPTAPLLGSPSYSQREHHSASSSVHHEETHDTIRALPSNYISALHPQPPTNKFKRPYQPDMGPISSPPHNASPLPLPAKRRKSSASKEAWTMSEDDHLLLELKDKEALPWKVIAQRFQEANRGEFRVPTLQMRYKRLKEKIRVWEADDIQILKDAKAHIEKTKWELIRQHMVERGCKIKNLSAAACEKKWKELAQQQIGQSQPMSPLHEEMPSAQEMQRDLSSATCISDPGEYGTSCSYIKSETPIIDFKQNIFGIQDPSFHSEYDEPHHPKATDNVHGVAVPV